MFHHDGAHTGYTSNNGPTTTPVKVWSYNAGSPLESSPAVANSYIYIGSDDGTVYALGALSPHLSASLLMTFVIAVVAVILAAFFLVYRIRRKGAKSPPRA